MKTKDIITGFIILVVIIVVVLLVKDKFSKRTQPLVLPTPSAQERIADIFKGLEIPKDENKTELKSVGGVDGVGIATENTVLADLADPEAGYFYQVWIENGGNLVSLGKMRVAKGGYIFEGRITGQKIIISRESSFDNKLETKILEGSR